MTGPSTADAEQLREQAMGCRRMAAERMRVGRGPVLLSVARLFERQARRLDMLERRP